MPRKSVFSVYLGILAIWMQIFAPGAAMSMERAVDPFSVICSHTSTDDDGGRAPDQQDHHHQCDLCQICSGGMALLDRPVVTAFDVPVARPLRWKPVDSPAAHVKAAISAQPRGPPILI